MSRLNWLIGLGWLVNETRVNLTNWLKIKVDTFDDDARVES